MSRQLRGRAGRMARKETDLAQYGASLAGLLATQLRPQPNDRVLHIASPGASQLGELLAPRLGMSELVILVHTYDELEDVRAALAGLGNVHVINEIDDLDEDEQPFNIVSCVAPYQLGRDTVLELIEQGLRWLAPDGVFYLAGSNQHDFERYVQALTAHAREVSEVAGNGHQRVVAVRGRNIRPGGGIGRRRN